VAIWAAWPARLLEFGTPVFVLIWMALVFVVLFSKRVKNQKIVMNQFKATSALTLFAFFISLVTVVFAYLNSQFVSLAGLFNNLTHIANGFYVVDIWILFLVTVFAAGAFLRRNLLAH
jgi:hypothetical protein